jgi:hypothetical protein
MIMGPFSIFFGIYIIFGILLTVIGPGARSIKNEINEIRRDTRQPKWKLLAFKATLKIAMALGWPLFLPSIAKEEHRTKERAAFFDYLGNMNPMGIVTDEFPNAHGEFGTLENPIPTKSILDSQRYLKRLMTIDGIPINFTRIGSFSSPATEFLVDQYALSTEKSRSVGNLHLCPYAGRTSRKIPTGFRMMDSI